MSLNGDEKARAIALAMGTAQPESGFERHFVRAIEGSALPCSTKEIQWVEYFDQWYCDLVKRRIDDALQEQADESLTSVS